jgi:hypothetical protein
MVVRGVDVRVGSIFALWVCAAIAACGGGGTGGTDEGTGTMSADEEAGSSAGEAADTTSGDTGSGGGGPPIVYYFTESAPEMGELWAVDLSGAAPSEPERWAPPPSQADGDASPSLEFLGDDRFASFSVDGADGTNTRYVAPADAFPPAPPIALVPPTSVPFLGAPTIAPDGEQLAILAAEAWEQPVTLYTGVVDDDGQVTDLIELVSGSAGAYTHSPRYSAGSDRLFFVADDAQVGLSQLQMVTLDDPTAAPIVISDNTQSQAQVFYELAEDDRHLVFGVGAAAPYRLFEVDLTQASPGAPVELATQHEPPGVATFDFIGDGTRLLYFVGSDSAKDLFAHTVGSGDSAVQLNALSVTSNAGAPWDNVSAHPAGDLVVYRGFEADDALSSLHFVDLSAPMPASQLLHDPLAASQTATSFGFTADGDALHYLVLDRDTGERTAFRVDTSGATPGPPVALELEVDAGETLRSLQASPSGAWLAYATVDLATGGTLPHIWLHESATGNDTRVSLPDAGEVDPRSGFTADSSDFLFSQAAEADAEPNLYRVQLDDAALEAQLVTEHAVTGGFFWLAR